MKFTRFIKLFSLILAVVIIVGMVGCAKKGEETIQIGVILPLTGPIAVGGKRVLNGIEIAVEQYNVRSEKDVVLKVEDSKGEPAVGVSAIKNLIELQKIKLIIGDLTSSVTLAMAPIAEKSRVILLSPGASNPAVRDAGDYIFRIWTSDDFDGMVAANYIYGKLQIKDVCILYIQNDYGLGLKNAFEEQYKERGGNIVFTEAFDQGETSFQTILLKIKTKKCEGLYLAGQPREMGYIVKQLKEQGLQPLIFSNASVEESDFRTIAKNSGINIYYTTPVFDLNSESELVSKFVLDYKQKYNEDPDIASAHGYDAARVLFNCISDQSANIDSIKARLYRISDFPAVTGNITFDNDGDATKGLVIKRFNANTSESTILEIYR